MNPPMTAQFICGDCLIEMDKLIEASIKVDAIIGDLPYGTTACSWDEIIPFAPMWERVKKINKGVFVTTASQPFTSALVMSNPKMFKYEWIWEKDKPNNFAVAKFVPMKYHENVVVFYNSFKTYNPEMIKRTGGGADRYKYPVYFDANIQGGEHLSMKNSMTNTYNPNEKYPSTVLYFDTGRRQDLEHPTQKPVALYEYLIRTYTNEGDTVLDFTCGSGTTGVACVNTNRNCILIDKDQHWIDVSTKRVKDAQQQMRLF